MKPHPPISLDRTGAAQLKTLLGLAARAEGNPRALAVRAAEVGQLRRLLTELCEGRSASGALLLESVSDAEAPLDILTGIKELASDLVAGAPSEPHREAATVLYHAAVAAGLAHHGVNISSQPVGTRAGLYEDLALALAEEPLGPIFLVAAEVSLQQTE